MPRLVAQSPEFSGKIFDLAGPEVTVGRLPDNGIQIEHASISGHHGVFRLDGLDYTIRDLESTNGTRVNDERVTEHKLRRNDALRLGNIELLYDSEHAPPGQPLPTLSERVNLTDCRTEGRPADFINASPLVKKARGEAASVWTWILLGASVAAVAASGYFFYAAFFGVTPLT